MNDAEQKAVIQHIRGATVVHTSPFSSLEVSTATDILSMEECDKFVSPFYRVSFRSVESQCVDSLKSIYPEIRSTTVEKLLTEYDWRPRLTGAFFATLKRFVSFDDHITAEKDPTIKCLKMASLCSALWAERGVELVVVGGSAIEILTEGAYASGDLDLCHTSASLPMRERQEVMGLLGAKGGPRDWQVAGMFVDVLGFAESFAHTPYRRVQAPYGDVLVMKPEDLLVERVLVSVYPGENQAARNCAKKLVAMILDGVIPVDWAEVRRLVVS